METFNDEYLPFSKRIAPLIKALALLMLGQIAWLLGSFLSWGDWGFGARAFSENPFVDFAVVAGASTFFIYLFLAWPLSTYLYTELYAKKRQGFAFFLLGSLSFLSPPLLSFLYFFSDAKGVMGFLELFFVGETSLAIAIALYWKTLSRAQFTFFLLTSILLQTYFFGDVLSPFRLVFSFSVNHSEFYWARVVMPLATAVITVTLIRPRSLVWSNWKSEICYCWLSQAILITSAIALQIRVNEVTPLLSVLSYALLFTLLVGIMFFISGQRWGTKAGFATAVVGIVISAAGLVALPLTEPPGVSQQFTFAAVLLCLLLLAKDLRVVRQIKA